MLYESLFTTVTFLCYLHIISCWNPHAIPVLIFFLKPFTNTLVVICGSFSILHQFNSSIPQAGATLRPIVIDCQSDPLIFNIDRRVNREVILGCILVHVIVTCMEVPSRSEIKDSQLHVEAIRISIKSSIIATHLWHVELSDHFISIPGIFER